MKLNKTVEPNFKNISQSNYFMHLEIALWIAAVISIIINTAIAPVLGIKTILIIVAAIIATRESEFVFNYHTKGLSRIDSSALMDENHTYLDGLLLALLMPVGAPLSVVVISAIFGNYIVRNAFGGYSFNIFSVAITARIFAGISFSISAIFSNSLTNTLLTTFLDLPSEVVESVNNNVGLITDHQNYLLAGNTQVMLGMIPVFLLVMLMAYLLFTKTIDIVITTTMLISTLVIAQIINMFSYQISSYPLNSLFLGTMMFAIVFLASDKTVHPFSKNGKIVYAITIVFITFVIRELASGIDGVLFAILFANMLVPMINAKNGMKKPKLALVIVLVVVAIGSAFVALNQRNLTEDDYTNIYYYKTTEGETVQLDGSSQATANSGEGN